MNISGMRRLVHVGAAGDERIAGFANAAQQAGYEAPLILTYDDLWRRPEKLAASLREPALLRLDSPGEDFDAWRALAGAGAEVLAAQGASLVLSAALDAMRNQRGLFWRSDIVAIHRQTYAGLVALTRRAATIAHEHGSALLNDVEAIEICCDKARCHDEMALLGIAVPPALKPDALNFDALLEAMQRQRMRRVFIKPRYGSAAAGIVALALSGDRLAAWSPAEIVGQGVVYSAKKVRRFSNIAEIRTLVESALFSDAHIEVWIPKAGVEGGFCDLRLLVIAGEPQHCVLRRAAAPMTNLHLGGQRLPAQHLTDRLGASVWEAAHAQAQTFARRFPGALQLSFDIAIEANLKGHRFFEANVFGDLLRRVTHAGLDPYAAQIAALPGWTAPQRRAA